MRTADGVVHMDIPTLVTEAVLLLVPYLAKGGRTIADKVGKNIGDLVNSKAETLYETIKTKFVGNDDASQTLKRLEAMPEDRDCQIAMESVLKEVIAEDSQFQIMLDQLLVEVKQVGGGRITQVYSGGAEATQVTAIADRGGTAVVGNYTQIIYPPGTKPTGKSIIPFEVSEGYFKDVTFCQLSKGDFTVNDILTKSTFKFLKAFIPAYLIRGDYSANLNYTAVDYVDETHTDSEYRDVDGKWQAVPVTKTRRIEVRHHPQAHIDPTKFTELAVATDIRIFLDLYSDISELYSFCENLDSVEGRLKSFEKKFTKGATIAPPSVDQNDVKPKINERIENLIKDRICKNLQGDRQENEELIPTINIYDDAQIIYLPFWFAIYSYANEKYFLAMDGKDSSRRIESDKPKDASRCWGVFNIFVKYCLPLFILITLIFISIYIADRNFLESSLNNIILFLILPILTSLFISYRKSKDLINRSKQIRKEIYQKAKNGSIEIDLENNSD